MLANWPTNATTRTPPQPRTTTPRCRRPICRPADEARRAGENRPAFEKALQVVGQFLRRGVALVRKFGDRLQHDRLEVERDVPIPMPQRLAT